MAWSQWKEELECLLVARGNSVSWERFLERAGIYSRRLAPENLSPDIRLDASLLFVDVGVGAAALDELKERLQECDDPPAALVALMPGVAGEAAEEDLAAAWALGADSFILSDMPPATVAARIRFAVRALVSEPRRTKQSVAVSDPLTGLTSYALLRRRLALALKRDTERSAGPLTALIVLDLDRFTRLTSGYGRAAADEVLVQIAGRLRRAVGEAALSGMLSAWTTSGHVCPVPMVARLQADDFAVVAPGLHAPDDAVALADALLEAVAAPLTLGEQSLYLSASIGIALGPRDSRDPDMLMRHAQSALNQAKQNPASSYAFYSGKAAATEAEQLELEHRLREALQAGELQMYYQPQVEIASGRPIGVEALVRWNHPERGLIGAGSFMEIARKAGITGALGRWALGEALREVGDLEAEGLPPMRVAINISADMFDGVDLADLAFAALDAAGFPAERLTLEMTEHSIVQDTSEALRTIERLKMRGVRLALDDFGTGYSALSYLKTLPIDELKIDRSFIASLDSDALALLRAIISMAKTLGMTVLAEGVETEDQLARLAEEGCDLYQGWLCSPAVPGDELRALVTEKTPA